MGNTRRFAAGLALMVAMGGVSVLTATTASASASQCVVDLQISPPYTIHNTGAALCGVLNGGSQVRAVVWCGTTLLPPHYGPWVSRANTYSKYNCGGQEAVLVNYQTR